MENYIILEELAQTQFSTILKCRNKKTKDIVVLKVINEKKTEDAPSKQVLREIVVMTNFKHINVSKINYIK